MVAFGFLSQNFVKWQVSIRNDSLSFYECRFSGEDNMSGGDTQTIPAVIKFT